MFEIKRFDYKKESFGHIKAYNYGQNWPVVYILEDSKEAYIGETTAAYRRATQHFERADRAKLKSMYVIADDEYNKSATLDIEAELIKYMSGDGKYLLQNANYGIQESNYYDREKYKAKFEIIWKELQKHNIAQKDLHEIENSDLFKYSPYKSLTPDQFEVVEIIMEDIKAGIESPHLVSGEPGTGKTIVATYLVKALTMKKWASGLKIGLVIPMTSLRETLRKVFRKVKGLNAGMILGPNDIVKDNYDILIVDEAHRLQRRVNLTSYGPYDKITQKLGLVKGEATQLDWIMKCSKYQVLFYDKFQTIKPSDIQYNQVSAINFIEHKLVSQMRVKGGNSYIEYVRDLLDCRLEGFSNFYDYEFKLYHNIKDMVQAIKSKDKEYGLARMVAGFAWKWRTKAPKKGEVSKYDFDIEIQDEKLRWNSLTKDWPNSSNAVNEVGCIHTIQGYDLNYTGVIIGPEVSYDEVNNCIVIDQSKYKDFNGSRSISDPRELEIYIKNIYKTLMTRGIRGTYVYVVDEKLRGYMERFVGE